LQEHVIRELSSRIRQAAESCQYPAKNRDNGEGRDAEPDTRQREQSHSALHRERRFVSVCRFGRTGQGKESDTEGLDEAGRCQAAGQRQ
jgi:hypothetical protein